MAAGKYLSAEDVGALLNDWQRLNADLLDLPIVAVWQLLEAESIGRKRPQFLIRLYGRFNRLRGEEERAALLRGRMPAWDTSKTSRS